MYTQIKNIKAITIIALMTLFIISCNKEDVQEDELNSLEDITDINSKVNGLKNPASVMYVEVNDNDMRNVGAYTLPNGKPLFDIGIIFAANINYSSSQNKAVLFLNPQVKSVLKKRKNTIRPLQNKGIKVLLSILGNHQGVGIANFTSRNSAKDFAKQVAKVVKNNGLDGVDLDDEFSKYGENGQPQPNKDSFMWLIQELRAAMPNKIITYYKIGPSSNYLQQGNKKAGNFLDYAFQPFYGRYDANISVPGMGKNKLAAGAVNVQETSASVAADFARRTKNDNFGALVMYNLDGTDRTSYLNSISQGLYGKETKLTGTLRN